MQDAAPVGGGDRGHELHREIEEGVERQALHGHQLRELTALDQLGDDEAAQTDVFDRVHGEDTGLVERGGMRASSLEPREARGVERHCIREHLDRDLTAQLGVAGAIHLTHATGAEGRQDLEVGELGADRETQGSYLAIVAQPSRLD